MFNTTYSAARKNLASIMTQTVQDCEPILITRKNGEDCVLISSSEYGSLKETADLLLCSPANTMHLLTSLEQASKGELRERQLDE
ncbi:type II toxin-antitoxin system prevent-host-death family antitoxin [Candidatus Fukatsuia symbiotica]|uniref:Antitoxin n=1 Tax=Candidatus Fukatsuia symbiotica TaxID=1878942 RepID=A0A2U8I4R0_9GAMM|nr:type II toxin-antitoxin system prevent-host-death family antitoxin [Candidatus Fukatsuia symbiotica]AWK14109.1 type II toxin-antitoxin system prevent-host-death family antitoxin [Candidatus Fukatsuia symbiotica]MEA9446121.1 type II toxin-antitoxin system prevent-host-death family antitoxin [Candidatus Fukatsuia symbiotica]